MWSLAHDACAGAASAAMAVWCGARIRPLERRVYSITLVVRSCQLLFIDQFTSTELRACYFVCAFLMCLDSGKLFWIKGTLDEFGFVLS